MEKLWKQLESAFDAAGFGLWLVGGAVRDRLLAASKGTPEIHDLDLATEAPPEVTAALLKPFGSVFDTGQRFGTMSVAVTTPIETIVEVTTFRTETYEPGSRKPVVAYGHSLHEDLSRRDFTINAIAERTDGTIFDPFGGQTDLANGVLRTPLDPQVTLAEDPLRILRAVRFEAVLGFTAADELQDAIRRTASQLSTLPRERITAEVQKAANAGVGGRLLERTLDYGLEEFVFAPFTVERDPEFIRHLSSCRPTLATLLAALVANDRNRITPTALVSGWRVPKAVATLAVTAGRLASFLEYGATVTAQRLAFRHAGILPTKMALDIVRVDRQSRDEMVALAHSDVAYKPLPVDGKDALAAGLSGPAIGAALAAAEAAWCADPSLGRAELLETLRMHPQGRPLRVHQGRV